MDAVTALVNGETVDKQIEVESGAFEKADAEPILDSRPY